MKNISKTFPDGTKAVQDVSLDINGGETTALVGPSGCGKTTLLRIIGGLEKNYESGEVWFEDRKMDEVPTEKRNIGIVFQNYALFPNMNVYKNVAFGLKVRKLSQDEIEKRVMDSLSLVRISELRHRSIAELSGGQRQRVALARALAIEPDVLLLDEPLTALDAKLRDKLRIELDSLLTELQITTIFVTHDQVEAMSLGDRIAVMKDGKICQIGTPMEVYKKPKEVFVATFIGTNNLLHGKIIAQGKTKMFCTEGVSLQLPDELPEKDHEEVQLLFRPEDIQLSTSDKAQLIATIKNAFYLGEKTRLICTLSPDNEITVDIKESENIILGQKIYLEISSEKLYIIKE